MKQSPLKQGQSTQHLLKQHEPKKRSQNILSESLFHKLDALDLNALEMGAPHTNTGHSRWIIPYADLLTLLLGLFMVLFSMSHLDKQTLEGKAHQLKQSLDKVVAEKVDLQKKQAALSLDKLKTPEQLKTLELALQKQIAASGDHPLKNQDLKIRMDERGLVISLTDSLLFSPGSADLEAPAREKLNIITRALQAAHRPIRVEGHTDNTPIATSQYPSNWELSTARATSIIRYLVQTGQFSPEQLSAAGYGEFHPVAENSSIEGKRKNRRVDIVLLGVLPPQQVLDASISHR